MRPQKEAPQSGQLHSNIQWSARFRRQTISALCKRSDGPYVSWHRIFLTNDIRMIYHLIPAYLETFHIGLCLPAIPPSTWRKLTNQLLLRCLCLARKVIVISYEVGLKALLRLAWVQFPFLYLTYDINWYHIAYDLEGSILCCGPPFQRVYQWIQTICSKNVLWGLNSKQLLVGQEYQAQKKKMKRLHRLEQRRKLKRATFRRQA